MWFIGDDVDDPYGTANDDHMKTNESISSSMQETGDILTDRDSNLPLSCPCSEATFGSMSHASLQSLRRFSNSPSSTGTISCIKNERQQKTRGIAKVLATFFVLGTILLLFLSDTSVRWMKCMHNLVMKDTWGGRSSSSVRRIATPTTLNNEKNTKQSHLMGDSRQANRPHVYHSNGTIRAISALSSNSNLHRPSKESRRQLKDGYYKDGGASEGVILDSSSESNTSPQPNPKFQPEEPLLDPQLVIAGKMTVDDEPCNIAQLNLKTGKWSLRQRILLTSYSSYSGGEVYSLLANHSLVTNSNAREYSSGDSHAKEEQPHVKDESFGSNLIVVGSFDTTYRNSQTAYCSVGLWDGSDLSKIGEGLCNSGLSFSAMKITCSAIAGPNDLFVGGSFQTQVWNGNKNEFVKIFNIAHYNATNEVWLPLLVGQIGCSWCTVTILALAWDSERRQLHVAGKFNAIDGRNIPAGLAVYYQDSGHLVAHPGGGLAMRNITEDGVGTALQFDQENGVLYVMGAFERLTKTNKECLGLAAYEINTGSWTCLADPAHSVLPTGGGNMLLTPYGLLVAGKTTNGTTWPNTSRPYTVAVLKATIKKKVFFEETSSSELNDDELSGESRELRDQVNGTRNETIVVAEADHEFMWSWLPGFQGHNEPLHTLSNGFGDYVGTVFIGGDNFLSKWSYKTVAVECDATTETKSAPIRSRTPISTSCTQTMFVPVTVNLANEDVHGMIMAISQLDPHIENLHVKENATTRSNVIGYTIIAYCVTLGALIGIFLAFICNKSINQTITSFLFDRNAQIKGISLDTLTYSHVQNTTVAEAYHRAMSNRFVEHSHLLTLIDPQEVILHRIIGEGTFGRVWSAKWGSSSVAVKEFVFAQAAIAGKSMQQQAIVEEIIGEAGMMAILRHPNVLQLFGCSLTAQAIWIVSELCSLGSLRQLLDDRERTLPLETRLNLALQVAEGMSYLHAQDPPIIHRDLKSHNIFVHETFAEELETNDKSNEIKLLRWPLRSSSGGSAKIEEKIESNNDSRNESRSHSRSESNSSAFKAKPSMSAKIGDWGSARATFSGSRTMTHGVGTACWMAPEVLKHARCSKFSDVYGFGIILWELATRREVYSGLESTQIIAMVANDRLRPEIPPGCPWNAIMVKCWREAPSDRPTFEEVVKELNRLRPTVEKSTYTGENFLVPKCKSYQKGALPDILAKGEDVTRSKTG
ncbi:hypothetical protein ACHAW5_006223 [Stephanodiscus triporus]|uniref:Protein kinase domain-containing protein n=1 Tax=Stephanodiscus triporus TaxID=2934178 RepID=A0ABD3NNA7_9STRA